MNKIEKWDRITGIILLWVGVIAAWGSISLSMGRFKNPGPGFLPFGLGVCLIILSLILIIKQRKKETGFIPLWPHQTWLRPLLGLTVIIFYAIVMNKLGFILTTFVFLLIWMGLIERLRWKIIFSVSIGTTLALYFLFVFFLGVPLPKGLLNW